MSDSEEQPNPTDKVAAKPARAQTAAGFAVNESNPRKIQVNLGGSVAALPDRDDNGEPAPKRAKVGGSGVGGFNAMLPAPKRENEKPTSSGTARKVFSLKTGAEPGFSREADAEMRQLLAEQTPTPKHGTVGSAQSASSNTSEASKLGNSMRFRPLSVARNTDKKKTTGPALAKKAVAPVNRTVSNEPASTPATTLPPPKRPKVSLFSAGPDLLVAPPSTSNAEPTEADIDTEQQTEDIDEGPDTTADNNHSDSLATTSSQTQSLDTIASDLNLSPADRRRLFGRDGRGSTSAINVVNFNTDQEYAANEVLRASGEQFQHNPVRGIAPGKHSLKQLVNAASTQKDALEESFAAGKSNKREAGSRYGW